MRILYTFFFPKIPSQLTLQCALDKWDKHPKSSHICLFVLHWWDFPTAYFSLLSSITSVEMCTKPLLNFSCPKCTPGGFSVVRGHIGSRKIRSVVSLHLLAAHLPPSDLNTLTFWVRYLLLLSFFPLHINVFFLFSFFSGSRKHWKQWNQFREITQVFGSFFEMRRQQLCEAYPFMADTGWGYLINVKTIEKWGRGRKKASSYKRTEYCQTSEGEKIWVSANYILSWRSKMAII